MFDLIYHSALFTNFCKENRINFDFIHNESYRRSQANINKFLMEDLDIQTLFKNYEQSEINPIVVKEDFFNLYFTQLREYVNFLAIDFSRIFECIEKIKQNGITYNVWKTIPQDFFFFNGGKSIMFSYDWYFLLPEIYLIFIIFFLLLMYTAFDFRYRQYPYFILSYSMRFSFAWSLLLLCMLYSNIFSFSFIALNFYYISTYYIWVFKIFFCFLCLIFILLCGTRKVYEFEYKWEFFLILSLSILGLLVFCSSYDFVLFYLSIELYSLSIYILVSWHVFKPFSTEAGLKYFILGSFSSGLLLLGMSFIYFGCGSLNFEDIGLILYQLPKAYLLNFKWIIIGFFFICFGLFFKLGIAPFHMWNPDVYEGAPYIITMFMAIFPKIILVLTLYRVLFITFVNLNDLWLMLSNLCCLISFLIGSLGAIYQVKIKRILAYSSINNAGFFLLAVASNSVWGLSGGFLYIFIYSLIMLGVFVFFLALVPFSSTKKTSAALFINLFTNLFSSNSLLAFSGGLLLLSLAGIPPLFGFFGKFIIFYAAFENNLYFIGTISMFFTIVTCFYYLRLVRILFFSQKEIVVFLPCTRGASLVLGSTILINILFFFFPEYLFMFIHVITISFFF